MGLVLAVLSLVGLFAAYFLGRIVVARLFGVRGIRAALGLNDDAWVDVSLGRRVGTSVGGFVGYYLGVALVVTLGFVISGEIAIDETTMRVNVGPDGPAARAGVLTGDRILAVGDVATPDWSTLKTEVAKHAGEAVAVRVERGGAQRTIMVTPDGEGMHRGKMLIGPPMDRRDISPGAALGRGLVEPFRVVAVMGRGVMRMVSGTERPELSGPVGIVQETSRASNQAVGDGLRLVGALASYSFYVALVVSALTVPRSRPRAPAKEKKQKVV